MIHVDWPRTDPRCGTRVTSVQALKRAGRLAAGDFVYIGMEGKAATAYGVESRGFGKPWDCLRDPRGWRFAYAAYLKRRLRDDLPFRYAVMQLHGQTLACWCKESSRGADPDCHGDLLARYAEWLTHDEAACLASLTIA